MADLAIIVPTRGRPDRFAEMVDAVTATADHEVDIIVCLDDDDPTGLDYADHVSVTYVHGTRNTLAGWTNTTAAMVLGGDNPPAFMASLGDDHRPRTRGWDTKLMAAAERVDGWSYGNDLLAGAQLPTAWVVKTEIVRQLGWLMLPACDHLYVDNAVLELGRRTNRIAYVPSVIVEHQHPLGGQTEWDESYRETNATERYAADKAAFESWLADGIDGDIATVGVRS